MSLLSFYRYSIGKIESTKQFSFNLAYRLEIDEEPVDFNILSDYHVPIPVCNRNSAYMLPGDGTIEDFARRIGTNFTQLALNVVLRQLRIDVS